MATMGEIMSLLDVLLPPKCTGCARVGALLCKTCRRRLVAPSDPANRFLAPDAGVVTGDALLLALAAFAYGGSMRRALTALKYAGVSRLAPIFASVAAPILDELLRISGPSALVPIPVHLDRLHERGYNQAALLAAALGRTAHMPMAEPLIRTRPTMKQHRLNRAARLLNLRDAFAVVSRPPARVVLVDDIITTTATLEACASALRDAGSEAVYGFAIACEV